MQEFIHVKGAREHNLKNIEVTIPRNRLVVFTGVSGSGKSSLAFDTIYSEGQRRYVESLSTYARQFLGKVEKPDVDLIEGLSPAISIDQKTTSNNPRSTVGTVTEIYDYLRLLYARVGVPYCPNCHRPIQKQTVDQVVDAVLAWPEGTKFKVLAPIVRAQKGEHKKTLAGIFREGFARVVVDGNEYTADEEAEIRLSKNIKHDISVVVDRLVCRPATRSRLAEALELSFRLSEGLVDIHRLEEDGSETPVLFSQNFSCPECGFNMPALTPRMFSFNSPFGACPACDGLGQKQTLALERVFDFERSIEEGAVRPWAGVFQTYYRQLLNGLCEHYAIPTDIPLKELTQDQLDLILYGNHGEIMTVQYINSYGEQKNFKSKFEGVLNNLTRRYQETRSDSAREELERYMVPAPCDVCHGKRLKPEVLAVRVGDCYIDQISALSVEEALTFFDGLEAKLSPRDWLIARQVVREIRGRLNFLVNVGLTYLSLDRLAGSLSGGEAQRIRLATQVGASLVGVLYVLDEPSIGLHPRDNDKLIATLKHLRDLGNSVIVVEHDEETMRAADYLVDIGPTAGVHGGQIVASGSLTDLMAAPESLTGQYLAGTRKIEVPATRRPGNGHVLKITGAKEHNLKNLTVEIPLGKMTVVTGVSGSGKSTLIEDILYPALMKYFYKSELTPGRHDRIEGMEQLERVVNIDQSPIGRTPRSNPATYTGAFDLIRALFAETPEAKIRGYAPGRFSFNVRGGRCEACSGDGIIRIEMHFLPDVYIPCEVCKGKRYNHETLEVRYKGKTIADVLDMTVEEAVQFFEPVPRIHRKLKVLEDVGLGYISLGQPATGLSGGEAQRVKLATELSKRSTGKNLYILDEPTTGLHMEDVRHLLAVLNRLTDAGNTVVIIEHNLDVIKCADHIIDLGPEGGSGGGQIIAAGTPEEIAAAPESFTGQYLKPYLQ